MEKRRLSLAEEKKAWLGCLIIIGVIVALIILIIMGWL